MFAVSCEELGVNNCNYQARGVTPGEALKKMVTNLNSTHAKNLPQAEVILKSRQYPDDTVLVFPEIGVGEDLGMDESARLITERLINKLNFPEGSLSNQIFEFTNEEA